MSVDKPDRPSGLILKDITIRNRTDNADNGEIKQASESGENVNRSKPDLYAGLFQDTAQSGNVDNYEMISIHLLDDFYDHPFKPYSEEDMNELAESIKLLGILHPIVARKKEDGRYEILSGHNRNKAAKLAGLRTVPCKVVAVDDYMAKMILTDTNLRQRERISCSEKSRAYKMQLDAMKKQGKRRDLLEAINQENNLGQTLPEVKNARDMVAEINNTSARQISNYIRLLSLIDGLLEKVDSEKIPFVAGLELSYLPKEMQKKINTLLDTFENLTVSVRAGTILRTMAENNLNNDDLLNILSGKKLAENQEEPKTKKFTPFKAAFKAAEKQFKKVDRYTAESIDEKELEKIVVDAVEEYLIRKRQ